jgi:hypothetical protein
VQPTQTWKFAEEKEAAQEGDGARIPEGAGTGKTGFGAKAIGSSFTFIGYTWGGLNAIRRSPIRQSLLYFRQPGVRKLAKNRAGPEADSKGTPQRTTWWASNCPRVRRGQVIGQDRHEKCCNGKSGKLVKVP